MTDEQRRAMFARLRGGGGGSTARRNPYEITNPGFGGKAGAFLSGFASGALEGLGNIGSVLTFKPIRDKWEDDFWRNNEGRRIAEAEKRAAAAEREAKKYKPTEEEKRQGKPHPMQAAVAASLLYDPPTLPERPDPIPRPQQRSVDEILSDLYGTDPGAAADQTAAELSALASEYRQRKEMYEALRFLRPEAPATERQNIQAVRAAAAAKEGATSESILAAVNQAKADNAKVSRLKHDLRKAQRSTGNARQREREEKEVMAAYMADYNAELDRIAAEESANRLRVQDLDKGIARLEVEARKATERAATARQKQEIAKEKERLRLETQQAREIRAWERAQAKQERDYQKEVKQAKREAIRERRQEYKDAKKGTSAYVRATHEGQTAKQEEIYPGAPHSENKDFYELMGHFYPKNWKDYGQKKAWYMALGVVNDLVGSGALANRQSAPTWGNVTRALEAIQPR
jgi:hypothetical protein